MAVAANQHRQALELGRKHRLEEGFQVPPLHEHGVEPTFTKALADLGRVAAQESVKSGPSRDVVAGSNARIRKARSISQSKPMPNPAFAWSDGVAR